MTVRDPAYAAFETILLIAVVLAWGMIWEAFKRVAKFDRWPARYRLIFTVTALFVMFLILGRST